MIGITTVNGLDYDMDKRFSMFYEVGFSSILLWWGQDECAVPRAERVNLAHKYNLIIENAHASARCMNSLWKVGEHGEATLGMLQESIKDCGRYGISKLVIHLTNGDKPPSITPIGIKRFEKLLKCAEDNKVVLAVENMRVAEHVRYVLDNYHSPYIGLCFDSGHQNIWGKDIDWLNLYNDRVVAVHLHDKFGDCDSHLIPYDGDIDWDSLISKLRQTSYKGTLTFESEYHSSNVYEKEGYQAFLEKLVDVGKSMFSNLNSDNK